MKKFFTKLTILLMSFMLMAVIAIVVDPYNVFHYRNIRDNGIEPNKNYIKMRYVLDNQTLFDSYLFGSSRVGAIDVARIPELHCYNMTYSEGIPREHFQNLEVMIKQKIIPNTVLIGIDDIACYVRPETHYRELLRKPYPVEASHDRTAYLKFLASYIMPDLLRAIPIMILHTGDDLSYRKQFYENGGWLDRAKEEDENPYWEGSPNAYVLPFHYGIANVLTDIKSIINLCDENNINLILFTNPLHKLTYKHAVKNGYIDFLSQLAEMTGYYNFSGINDITINNDNYFETSHYKAKIGDLMVDAIFNGKVDPKLLLQGFGYHVTPESKVLFIDLLMKQL